LADPKPDKRRLLTVDHDQSTPAFKVVVELFGGVSAFKRTTGIPITTCHDWLRDGYIPSRRIPHIRAVALREGIDLPVEMLVGEPKLDPRYCEDAA
jgi:hypothetical protein